MNTNDGNQKELNGGFGLCSVLYDRFSNCMTFGGQLRQIHRDGSAENCGDIIMDYSKCLLAQSSQDEKKKKVSKNYFTVNCHRFTNSLFLRNYF